jgi:hypothetical protein
MIYIQSNDERTLAHHFDCSCALYGAIENGLDYRLTTFDEVQSGKFDQLIRKNLFVGSVEFMREVFNRVKLNDVRIPKNSNRVHWVETLGEIKRLVQLGNKYFIKPFEIKLFTGFVIDQMQYTSIQGLPDDTPVMVYDVFKGDLLSEWRVYINNHKMVDSRNYSGDFTICPNYDYVQSIIKENKKDFPVSYTMDIGILSTGENVVVEFNDMWSIGNYGIDNGEYLKLLRTRYHEIMGNSWGVL